MAKDFKKFCQTMSTIYQLCQSDCQSRKVGHPIPTERRYEVDISWRCSATPTILDSRHLEFQGALSEMVVFLPPVFVPDAEVQACLGTAGGWGSGGPGGAGSVAVGPRHSEPSRATLNFNRFLFVPLHDIASGAAGGPQ